MFDCTWTIKHKNNLQLLWKKNKRFFVFLLRFGNAVLAAWILAWGTEASKFTLLWVQSYTFSHYLSCLHKCVKIHSLRPNWINSNWGHYHGSQTFLFWSLLVFPDILWMDFKLVDLDHSEIWHYSLLFETEILWMESVRQSLLRLCQVFPLDFPHILLQRLKLDHNHKYLAVNDTLKLSCENSPAHN